jgi:hypothetical protein
MARSTSFQPDRSMLEGERSHLFAMALGAAGFIGAHRLDGAWQRRPVRVVTIHATHGAFRQPVFVWLLETGPYVGVAPGALLIDLSRLPRYQTLRAILVNRMARRATHLILGMTAVETSGMSTLILMAGEAGSVGFKRFQFGRLPDIGSRSRFRMLASRTMTAFASLGVPAALLVGFHHLVRILLEGVEDVLVAHLAGLRPDELHLGWRLGGRGRGRFFLSAHRGGGQ